MRAWRLCDADWNHWPNGLDDSGVWAVVAEGGFDGVELGVYRAEDELAPERLEWVQALARSTGVPVAMLLLSLPAARWPERALSSPATATEVAAQALVTARTSVELGLGTMGLWPGADPPGGPARAEAVLHGLGQVAEAVAPTGVRIALEYKPGTAVASATEALALCDAVPGLGVLVDTGHAFAAGEDPAEVVVRAGDRLAHLHLGDAAEGNADDDLPVGRLHDFAPLVAALDATGYAGAASLDLYGAVCAGVATGAAAGAESRAHLLRGESSANRRFADD
ncbi:MAG: sugar phosphate isomerase/epimerase family protein [Acidimicrobiales bacterium]